MEDAMVVMLSVKPPPPMASVLAVKRTQSWMEPPAGRAKFSKTKDMTGKAYHLRTMENNDAYCPPTDRLF